MFGAIDLGTNSARLLVGKVKADQIEVLLRKRQVTRMGEGLGSEGEILAEARIRTIHALKHFKQLLQEMPIKQLEIFATSAARRATDLAWLEGAVTSIFQQSLRVLSGEEEALLSYQGAVKGLGQLVDETKLPVVVDIGGGSSEVCTIVDGCLKAISLEIGAVRETEKPITEQEMDSLLEVLTEITQLEQSLKLIGAGGTVTSLAAIDQSLKVYDSNLIHGCFLSYTKVQKLFQRLRGLTLEQRRNLPGLEPERADIIIAGTKILLAVMNKLNCREIIVSERDLLDGMLLSMINQN